MADKLVFVHSSCGKKTVNDAICSRCGQEIQLDSLAVHDSAMAAARGGGIRPAMPSEADYFSRTRQFPAAASKEEEAAIAKRQDSYVKGFEDRIASAVAKALIAAQKKGAKA